MRYSIDLRKRVLEFIETGGSKAEASRRFKVSRTAIYKWLAAQDPFTYEKPGPRKPRLIDSQALRKHVADFPDATLAERAEVFGVSREGIHYALGKCGITRKKSIRYKEQCPEKRATYQATLATALQVEKRSPIYVDECGFTAETLRPYGYAPRGTPVEDKSSSQQYKQTSLIAARTSQGFKAPELFKGTCNAKRFNQWLETHLCPELTSTDIVIMDNAPWHKTLLTKTLITQTGAQLLYLPPYSPDLNPIEHDFANIKRCWQYKHEQTIENIINMYT